MAKNRFLDTIKNFWFSTPQLNPDQIQKNDAFKMSAGGSEDTTHNLSNFAVPTQFRREYYDISSWKASISEAEQLPYPFRVRQQRIYIDVINNGHVVSCMNKRKNLNLSKTYVMQDEEGNPNEEWTKYFMKPWFYQYINNVLDARAFGYSLISIGDIDQNYDLNTMAIIRRWLVSPDRLNVANIEYMSAGTPFLEGDAAPWHIWVKTPSDIGVSGCGYGYLYQVALPQIVIKDNLTYNLSFNELFAGPTKVLYSSATDPKSRAEDGAMLQGQGNSSAVVLRKEDELEFIEAKSGSGYKAFPDLEKRYQDEITAIILGHRAAIDAVPGQLGNTGEDSAAGQALKSIEISDNMFLMPYIDMFIDRLRFLGVPIPQGLKMCVLNDDEKDEAKEKSVKKLSELSTAAANFAKAGIELPIEVIEELTGLKMVQSVIPVENTASKNNI